VEGGNVSRYSEGVRVEHAVIHDLTANGYDCTRAASSKGSADVVAVKTGQVLFVSVKRTRMPGPGERAHLLAVAGLIDCGVPLVALKPPRQPLEYRRLVGRGPQNWTPWTPDEVS
jgi:Holliday junction resolvase